MRWYIYPWIKGRLKIFFLKSPSILKENATFVTQNVYSRLPCKTSYQWWCSTQRARVTIQHSIQSSDRWKLWASYQSCEEYNKVKVRVLTRKEVIKTGLTFTEIILLLNTLRRGCNPGRKAFKYVALDI